MTALSEVDAPAFDCRVDFADELAALARADERIVAVCNDSVGSSNLVAFREEFPDRLINVGIAEQDLVGVAAGLANAGFIPFVCAAAPFLTGRATEQIKADVAYSQRHVVLCGQSPGMAYGELGPTHHSIEDISWMRAIADLPVVVPADSQQTRQAVRWAASYGRGVYLRIPRFKVPQVSQPEDDWVPGRAVLARDGRRRHDHRHRHDGLARPLGRRPARGRGCLGPGAEHGVRPAARPRSSDRRRTRDPRHRDGRGSKRQRRPRRGGCVVVSQNAPNPHAAARDPRRVRTHRRRIVPPRLLRPQHREHRPRCPAT